MHAMSVLSDSRLSIPRSGGSCSRLYIPKDNAVMCRTEPACKMISAQKRRRNLRRIRSQISGALATLSCQTCFEDTSAGPYSSGSLRAPRCRLHRRSLKSCAKRSSAVSSTGTGDFPKALRTSVPAARGDHEGGRAAFRQPTLRTCRHRHTETFWR